MHQTFLWIALDGLTKAPAKTLAVASELDKLEGNFGFKANLDWVLKVGLNDVRPGPLKNRPFFLDLKMLNGYRTMERVFSELHNAGVTATNAYAHGGGVGKRAQLKRAISNFRSSVRSSMRIYAVTLLSHYDEEYCRRHFDRTRAEETRLLAEEGVHAGADGIILSGDLRDQAAHLNTLRVLTGIRLEGADDGEHEEPTRPEAIAGLEDVEAVCGSPIMGATDPAQALANIPPSLSQ